MVAATIIKIKPKNLFLKFIFKIHFFILNYNSKFLLKKLVIFNLKTLISEIIFCNKLFTKQINFNDHYLI